MHREPEAGLLQTQLPSWIGLLNDSAYGPPSTVSDRQNADSLVGEPGQPIYNASNGLEPDVDFGQTDHQAVLEQAPTSNLLVTPAGATNESSGNMAKVLQGLTSDDTFGRMMPNRFDGRLSVKGISLGSIAWTSPRLVEGIVPGEGLQKLGWQPGDNLHHVPDRLWRTLVADRGPDGKRPPGVYRRACSYCLSNASSKGDINTEKLFRDQSQPQIVRDFLDRVRSVVWSRRIFTIEASEPVFGLSPDDAEPGDMVCIFYGCSVPVVVRKHDDHSSVASYQLVGECYVHGRMDGEALLAINVEELRSSTREFVLR
ncbi:MAG: hypothetical protein M1820_005379 [Bogoriella megaspora]|nr:MAG: hypothetical protein M1820_005379 [Bogoriella megaspora]